MQERRNSSLVTGAMISVEGFWLEELEWLLVVWYFVCFGFVRERKREFELPKRGRSQQTREVLAAADFRI